MKASLLLARAVLGALCAVPALSHAETVFLALRGSHEVPAVSTGAHGTFRADINSRAGTIRYVLRYEALEGEVLQAHIHFGQRDVNGGVGVFLCQTEASPDPTGLAPMCTAAPARVEGVLTAANVIGPSAQGIAAGEFDELVRAIRAGRAYVNVHSTTFPPGEIRGQTGHRH